MTPKVCCIHNNLLNTVWNFLPSCLIQVTEKKVFSKNPKANAGQKMKKIMLSLGWLASDLDYKKEHETNLWGKKNQGNRNIYESKQTEGIRETNDNNLN